MTAFPLSGQKNPKKVFSPLALSHSKKHGSGYSKFWQVYFHCSYSPRCHLNVTTFAEVSFLH